jgi:hypothetical protein
MMGRRIEEKGWNFGRGQYLTENPYTTQVMVAKAVGACEVYSELLSVSAEDINS